MTDDSLEDHPYDEVVQALLHANETAKALRREAESRAMAVGSGTRMLDGDQIRYAKIHGFINGLLDDLDQLRK